MKTVAVAARQWWISTALAAGVLPLCAPPLRRDTFRIGSLAGAGLLYVCLHGLPGQGYWYGSDWSTAISANQVRAENLSGTVVYLAGCFGQGPMTNALLDAGAACVVGDRDSTWAGYVLPTGSNALGRAFVAGLRRGDTVQVALDAARAALRRRDPSSRATALIESVDALGDTLARLVA